MASAPVQSVGNCAWAPGTLSVGNFLSSLPAPESREWVDVCHALRDACSVIPNGTVGRRMNLRNLPQMIHFGVSSTESCDGRSFG